MLKFVNKQKKQAVPRYPRGSLNKKEKEVLLCEIPRSPVKLKWSCLIKTIGKRPIPCWNHFRNPASLVRKDGHSDSHAILFEHER